MSCIFTSVAIPFFTPRAIEFGCLTRTLTTSGITLGVISTMMLIVCLCQTARMIHRDDLLNKLSVVLVALVVCCSIAVWGRGWVFTAGVVAALISVGFYYRTLGALHGAIRDCLNEGQE